MVESLFVTKFNMIACCGHTEEYKDPIISDGSSDTELSPTELAIVIVVVLIAGCLIGCLGMWYWRKKQNHGISQPSKTVELNAMP